MLLLSGSALVGTLCVCDGVGWVGRHLPLFNDIAEDFHHAFGLFFCEAFFFQALHEFQRVVVVVFGLARRCAEGASSTESRGMAG